MPLTLSGGLLGNTPVTPSLVASLVTALGLGIVVYLIYVEARILSSSRQEAVWSVFDISSEHKRLHLDAKSGQSAADIKLRGEAYVNSVMLLRDAAQAAELRARAEAASLAELVQSAQATLGLVASLDGPEARDALLRQLRADAPMVRDAVLDLALLDRQIGSERRSEDALHCVLQLLVLGFVMLAMLALSLVAIRLTGKLRETGRALSTHLANQEAILRSVDEAILVLGPEGSVFYSNPNAQLLLGLPDTSGRRFSTAEGAAPALAGEIAAMFREGEGLKHDGPMMRKVAVPAPGGTRHHVIRVFPASTEPAARPDGNAGHATHVVVIRDVTTTEELSQRREEYDAGLVEASRLLALAAISGGIVHEISQPLAAIRNYVYSLKVHLSMHPGTEEQSVIARHLGEEIDRAIEVVRNVRRLASPEMQETCACDLQEAIEHSVRLAALGLTPPPPIAIHAPEPRTRVAGSLPMLGQVIVNLLNNAIAASAEAGRAGAEVRVRLADGFARITVDDFGNGVSAEAARTLFSPFSKSTRGGMGLGLAICQRLAATLGGSLSWENRSGGASFTFTVPIAKDTR